MKVIKKMIPHVTGKSVEKILDKFRPGWRERKARKKSPWNLACVVAGFALLPVFWYGFFQAAWNLHLLVYPAHSNLKSQFWDEGISFRAFVSSALMLLPLGIPALVVGFLSANCLLWCIPSARRAMEFEAMDDKEMAFAGSNIGLIKWGGIASVVSTILSVIGAVTLESLK